MRFFYGTGFILIILLSSCGAPQLASYTSSGQPVNASVAAHAVDSIVKPYRENMLHEMSRVIGYSDSSLLSYAPESPLGNFVADIVFDAGFQYAFANEICKDSNAIFSLLNFGGLRTSINKGEITRGDIYELMPFDNTIVIVKISGEKMDSVVNYMAKVNGQPISNARIITGEQHAYQVGPDQRGDGVYYNNYYIITSDYLANGGDKMNFFKEPLETWNTGILMRDALITYIEKKKNIPYSPVSNRMLFVKP